MEGAVDKQEPEAAQLVSNGAPAEAPVADTTKSDALEAGEVKTHSVPGRLPSRKDSAFQVGWTFEVGQFLPPASPSTWACQPLASLPLPVYHRH